MNVLKTALALAACALLSGCKTLGGPIPEPPTLAQAPAALVEECVRPIKLPEKGGMTQAQAERAWIRDRANLIACANRHGGLARYYDARDEAIARQNYIRHASKKSSRRAAGRPMVVAPAPRVRVIRGASHSGSIW